MDYSDYFRNQVIYWAKYSNGYDSAWNYSYDSMADAEVKTKELCWQRTKESNPEYWSGFVLTKFNSYE